MLDRLTEVIAAVCPIDGLCGAQGSVRIDYRASATIQERAAAESALAAFDWSSATHAAWALEKERQRAVDWFMHSTDPVAFFARAQSRRIAAEIRLIKQGTPGPELSESELVQQMATLISTGSGDPLPRD